MAEKLLVAGVDVGSATAKAVVLDRDGRVRGSSLLPSAPNLSGVGREALNEALAEAGAEAGELAAVAGTGYGRAALDFAALRITEITCHARGASVLFPGTALVVDVGGQDSKAIRMGPSGEVRDFTMNDKCAAGTGRFLAVMAGILGTSLDVLGPAGLRAMKALSMTSTCTVFAESEVISLISQGEAVPDIAHAVHQALAQRLAGMVRMVGADGPAVFSGGGALNPDLVDCLQSLLGLVFQIPERPQLTGALGAAHLALRKAGA